MKNKIIDMNYYFSVEYIRNELINKLKKKGFSEKEIEQFMKINDEAYKKEGIPYPTLD